AAAPVVAAARRRPPPGPRRGTTQTRRDGRWPRAGPARAPPPTRRRSASRRAGCDPCPAEANPPSGSDEGASFLAVVRGEVVDDLVQLVGLHRRAVHLDHLVDLGLPALAIEEGRVHRDVVLAVAGAATADHQIPGWTFLELDPVLVRGRGRRSEEREDDERGHGRSPIR